MRKSKRKSEIKENKLDLHGIKHYDAPEIVYKFLESFTCETVRIVTGNSYIMNNIVTGIAREYGYTYTTLLNTAVVVNVK